VPPDLRDALAPPRRWLLLALLTVAYGMGAFGILGVSPLLPSLVEGFRLTRLDVAFVVPSVYLGGLLFSLPAGHLADRWGVRPTLLGGLALGAAGLALAAAAPRFGVYLVCIFLAGVGWSVVNPVLGKAIVDLFPAGERGVAMGIKQMGLTVGGVISALVLPPIAAAFGWRAAVVACAVVMAAPAVASWRALASLAAPRPGASGESSAAPAGSWWWLGRPALLMLFGAGVALGMVQSAVLSYLPLYGVEVLGFTAIAAGVLVAAAQAGGAAARLGLGAASDRWLGGRRPPWLVLSSVIAAVIFTSYAVAPTPRPAAAIALAFLAGIGAHGWVGIYFIASAEAGGPRQSGLLSGVAFTAIVVGLMLGAPVFGVVLEARDSYRAAWAVFAALCALVALLMALAGGAIHRECERARDGA
jgi:ACS family hexuronate transporter-like MFS transporter